MAKCGDCLHFQKCSHYVTPEETFPEVGGCSAFTNKGDFVEVVRCNDCKYWKHFDHVGCSDLAKVCTLANYMIGANGYCLYGERRDGE